MIDKFLEYLLKMGGSDLHIKIGNRPSIRVEGRLIPIEYTEPVTFKEMEKLKNKLLNEEREKELEKTMNCDFSYSIQNTGRFRINMSVQRGSIMIVARKIADVIKSLEELGLPLQLKEISREKRGLILVTGSTGSGKSTTVASMLEYVNRNFSKNIITFEDPIEFLFIDKKSLISQKEIPSDIPDFVTALKFVLRQDPDIIFIGELRDRETVEAALKASEAGHLIISTLHTVNASQTVSRLIDFFPFEQQKHIRHLISDNLKSVISQRLLSSRDRKERYLAVEIMKNTPLIKDYIVNVEGIPKINEAIKNGSEIYNMQSFDQSIGQLFLDNKIDYETALDAASVKKDIQLLKSGIKTGSASHFYKDFFEE